MRDSSSTAPPHGNRGVEEERPRSFDTKAKNRCWSGADTVPGRHPERWRKDAAGNIVCKRFFNCQGCLCFEYDHIVPYSKGGESTAENCQILQTRVNRLKSNKEDLDKTHLEGYSCDIKFTGRVRRAARSTQMTVAKVAFTVQLKANSYHSVGKRKVSIFQTPECL